jgi:hypothetical protein
MKSVADSSTSMASRIKASSIVSVAATATVVAGYAALAAQGVAAVAAVAPLAGLLAVLPSLALAAAGGVGVLMLATSGLAAAMKQSSGGTSNNGQAIVAAERRVQSAQQASTQAQIDLNAARQTAADRLIELSRLLNRAALDERGGVMAVADAEKALRAARASGDRSAIQHAQLALDEANQSLIEIRAHTADLTAEDQHRTTVGVEGSDEVQAALQRQAKALQDLADAQAALKTAGQGAGGVDAAAAAYAKLSVAGKQLVDVLRAIAPSWRSVQQAVQQAVFAGVAADVKQLSQVYLPVMREQLPAIGKGWNNAFRGTAQLAASAGFVRDINTTLGNTATFWQRIGNSFAPFLSGFRQFAVVGSGFLPSIGSWVERIANSFDRWATNARESGKAQTWIANSLTVLGQLWEITKNVGSSIASIFRAGSAGPDWLPGVVAGTQALSDFLASPAGQGKLAAVFATLREVGAKLWAVLTNLGPTLLDLFSAGGAATDTLSVFGVVIGFAADHLHAFASWLPVIIAGFIAYKALVAGAVVVETIRIPLLIAQTISNFALAGAMRATMVATGQATVAQWGLNAAFIANPIGIIILAIVALVGGIYLLWTHSAAFRDFWIAAWILIKIGFEIAVVWIHDKIQWLIDAVLGIRDRITAGAAGLWDGIVYSFKSAVNWMIRLWNDFHLTLGGGNVLGISIPSVTLDTPNIPYLAKGGVVQATPGGRLVVAGDGGEDEAVVPLSKLGGVSGGTSGGTTRVILDFRNVPDSLKGIIRKMVRTDGGGDVQIAFGS